MLIGHYGGAKKMSRKLAHYPIPIRVPPCCCCCFCLPESIQMTTSVIITFKEIVLKYFNERNKYFNERNNFVMFLILFCGEKLKWMNKSLFFMYVKTNSSSVENIECPYYYKCLMSIGNIGCILASICFFYPFQVSPSSVRVGSTAVRHTEAPDQLRGGHLGIRRPIFCGRCELKTEISGEKLIAEKFYFYGER